MGQIGVYREVTMKILIVSFSLLFGGSVLTWAASPEKNKEIVRDFYHLAFNKHKPRQAMGRYGGKKYIQHNPYAPDGKQAFIDFFEPYLKKNKEVRVEIKRLIAEGDLVVVHAHSKKAPNDRGSAVVDIFRLSGGKIVEHWDVVQAIPEKMAHSNSMF